MTLTVSIIDQTTKHRPPAGVVDTIARALAHQVEYHFAPAWQLRRAGVIAGGSGEPIYVFDNPDVAGALGYHDTDPDGRPYAHVFTDPSFEQGGSDWLTGPYSISSVLSHELLEMLGDPEANRFALGTGGRLWCQEACDAVENSSYFIAVHDVLSGSTTRVPVSNFVLPAWFTPGAPGPYDYLKHLTAPFTLEKGGYSIVAKFSGESQVTADVVLDEAMPDWLKSMKQGSGNPNRVFWRAARIAADNIGGAT